jgi:hypothetical protein
MTYTLIEDCSPYYIRFTWEELPKLIDFVNKQPLYLENNYPFESYIHWNYDHNTAQSILDQLPMNKDFRLNPDRVALFITRPGGECGIHKDGPSPGRCGINIALKILDDQCITSWYNDESFAEVKTTSTFYTRKAPKFSGLVPVKTAILKPNECVLFNTDIYHTWDNSKSINQRIQLTLRFEKDERVSFTDAKNILFKQQL